MAVREICKELDLPIHLWPDKEFIKHASEHKEFFKKEREKVESPETYPVAPS